MANASRYSIQESVTQLPGCCLICKGSKGPFVSPQISLNNYGQIYFCLVCLGQMALEFLPTPEPKVVREGVSQETYDAAVSSIIDRLTLIRGDLDIVLDSSVIFEESEDELTISTGLDGLTEQDSSVTGGEKPVGVSSDSDDGLKFTV